MIANEALLDEMEVQQVPRGEGFDNGIKQDSRGRPTLFSPELRRG